MQTALAAWAADTEPVKGVVQVAGDAMDGYAALESAPRGYRLVLWWAGDTPAGNTTELVASNIAVGIAVQKGLTKAPHGELAQASAARPAVLDIVEGVLATCRGLYLGGSAPGSNNDGCWLLTFTGSEWIAFEVGVEHYVLQLNFTLPRQLPARSELQVTLT